MTIAQPKPNHKSGSDIAQFIVMGRVETDGSLEFGENNRT